MRNFENRPQPENSKMSREQAELEIENIEQQISILEVEKTDLLNEVKQDTKSHKKSNLENRKNWQPKDFLKLSQQDNVVNLGVIKNEKDKLVLQGDSFGGKKIDVTPTDLEVDLLEWGIVYEFENYAVAAKDTYRSYNNKRAGYVDVYYEKQILDLKNKKQILERLYVDNIGEQDLFLEQAYESFLDEKKEEKAGFIFEKIISSSLRRISKDLGGKYGFEFEETSPIDDIEYKIDLLLKFNDTRRGLEVKESEEYFEKGFQITLHKDDEVYRNKLLQIEKVNRKLNSSQKDERLDNLESLVLLKTEIEMPEIMSKYHRWQEMKKEISNLPGGPDRLFSSNRIVEILSGIFQDSPLEFEKNPKFKEDLLNYFSKHNY